MKLTPNVADPAAVAVAAEEGGADAVSLINTLKARAIDPRPGGPGSAPGSGGLSGPAVRPVALAQVRAVAPRSSIPVIGMGGICERRATRSSSSPPGRRVVAVGTASFRDPLPPGVDGVAAELAELLRRPPSARGLPVTRPRL